MNAREILKDRQGIVRSATPDTTVFEAIKAMDRFKVGALMVIDKGKLVGIISERDYTRKVVLKDRSSKSTKVSDSKLSGNFVHCFEVGLQGSFLDIGTAGGARRIDIDCYQRFCVIDDQRPP